MTKNRLKKKNNFSSCSYVHSSFPLKWRDASVDGRNLSSSNRKWHAVVWYAIYRAVVWEMNIPVLEPWPVLLALIILSVCNHNLTFCLCGSKTRCVSLGKYILSLGQIQMQNKYMTWCEGTWSRLVEIPYRETNIYPSWTVQMW